MLRGKGTEGISLYPPRPSHCREVARPAFTHSLTHSALLGCLTSAPGKALALRHCSYKVQGSLSQGLHLVRYRACCPTLVTLGPAFQTATAGERPRDQGIPPPSHLPTHTTCAISTFSLAYLCPCHQGHLCCAVQARCRAHSSELLPCGQLSQLLEVVSRGMGRALPLCLCHAIIDECWGQLSHTHILRAGSPTPLLPGPVSLCCLCKS